jgi:hypothetical protein
MAAIDLIIDEMIDQNWTFTEQSRNVLEMIYSQRELSMRGKKRGSSAEVISENRREYILDQFHRHLEHGDVVSMEEEVQAILRDIKQKFSEFGDHMLPSTKSIMGIIDESYWDNWRKEYDFTKRIRRKGLCLCFR